ncbi:MAG: hypothetical protein KAJ01_01515, partial [Candidatus Hydrogenedentes bacterium]|nr:hypothetical protein [Candidatus Hydrogenedentota bacterium]
QGRIRFARLIIEYLGPADENPQLSVLRIEHKLTNRSSPSWYYYLDADGRLVRETIGTTEFRAVTKEEILAIYPLAEVQPKDLPE